MWFALSLFFALWTSISISIVKRLTVNISPLLLLLIINIFILPFMFILIMFQGGIPKILLHFYPLMLVSALLDVVAAIASINAIRTSSISLISPISSFNPVFTTIIAAFAIGESPSATKFLGITIVVVGAYLLNISDLKGGIIAPFSKLASHRGVQLFFLANFLWAITPIFQKQAIFQTSPTMPLFPSFFGSILVAIFIAPFALKRMEKSFLPIKQNVWWFLLLAPFSAIAQWAAFTAFSQTNVGYATAIFKLSTLFTILWGAIFFKEERIRERLLGGGVMILGTILLAV